MIDPFKLAARLRQIADDLDARAEEDQDVTERLLMRGRVIGLREAVMAIVEGHEVYE
jgi:multidrug resistance efflux pump